MRVQAGVVLKLFDLVNDLVVPDAALEACDELTDDEVADLLELFVDAQEDAGEKSSAFIKSAIRRLRKQPVTKEAKPNS